MSIFPAKYHEPSLLKAEMLVRGTGALKHLSEIQIPETVILFLIGSPVNLTSYHPGRQHKFLNGKLTLLGSKLAVLSEFGIGAPNLVFYLEILKALGAKKIITIGTCGSFHDDIKPGQVLLVEKSLRDEGTSDHYVPPAEFAFADDDLNKELWSMGLNEKLDIRKIASWTTDALFRETLHEIYECRKRGVFVVDMESSALFVVSRYLEMKAASLFVVSDQFIEGKWCPDFKASKIGIDKVFDAVARTYLNR